MAAQDLQVLNPAVGANYGFEADCTLNTYHPRHGRILGLGGKDQFGGLDVAAYPRPPFWSHEGLEGNRWRRTGAGSVNEDAFKHAVGYAIS